MDQSKYEELADYRRQVAELYADIRATANHPVEAWNKYCQARNALFARHPQSALSTEQKSKFRGLNYFDYNPAYRFLLPIEIENQPEILEVELPDEGLMRLQRFGKIHFEIEQKPVALTLFWVHAYGGGIFLPFRDLTNRHETYGGGRYLLDTIKNADLGSEGGKLVIDFNFAYNPSCAYNPGWVCPLAPAENWLAVAIKAGELKFSE
jgi:uncharacterized protein (DUF1684 family)